MPALPYDILYHIASRIAPSAYPALCLASRDWHSVATPLLYDTVSFDLNDKETALFLRSIVHNPTLGLLVKSVQINPVAEPVGDVCTALRAMQRLQHLDFYGLSEVFTADPRSISDAIASLLELTSINFSWMIYDLDMDALLDRLPPMRRISCDADWDVMPGLERLLLRSEESLEYLSLETYLWEDFLRGDGRGHVWPKMRTFDVDYMSGSPSLASAAFPNLRSLTVSMDPLDPDDILWDSTYFPLLQQLNFRAAWQSLSPEAGPRRSRRAVDCLNVIMDTETPLESSVLRVMECFQWRPLRVLSVSVPFAVLANLLFALPDILTCCSSLQHIGLDIDWPVGINVPVAEVGKLFDTMVAPSQATMLLKLRVVTFGEFSLGARRPPLAWIEQLKTGLQDVLSPVFDQLPLLLVAHARISGQDCTWKRRVVEDIESGTARCRLGLTCVENVEWCPPVSYSDACEHWTTLGVEPGP